MKIQKRKEILSMSSRSRISLLPNSIFDKREKHVETDYNYAFEELRHVWQASGDLYKQKKKETEVYAEENTNFTSDEFVYA